MSHISDFLRKKERVTITLPILLEYYITTKRLKGCSQKTLIGTRAEDCAVTPGHFSCFARWLFRSCRGLSCVVGGGSARRDTGH